MGIMDVINSLLVKLFTLPFIFICLTVHEFSHGWAAYRLGDTTAKDAGRLSLNPFKHVDWLGVLAMLFFGFGWAKPVPVNPYRFKKGGARGIVWVSLAGPVSNLVFAFLLLIVWEIVYLFFPTLFVNFYFYSIMQNIIFLNVALAVFNLIPVPPLDGSKVLGYLLPYNASRWLENNGNILYIIMIIAAFTGTLSRFVSPVSTALLNGMQYVIHFIFTLFV